MPDQPHPKPEDPSVGDARTEGVAATGAAHLVGRKFGLYTLEDLVGVGGQGAVYRAVDGQGKLRALKVIRRTELGGAQGERRLRAEADALERLRHKNVVAFHAFDLDGDYAWLATQYVDGESLGQRLRSGPLDRHHANGVLEHVLAGLGAAHDEGIVHRDLSANNVLLERATGRALLTDFGLAKGENGLSLTGTGAVVGTGAYIAPEVYDGRRAGPTADLWSVGVLACQMVAGRVPFEASTPAAMIHAVCHKEPDVSGLGGPLLELARACLVKEPERRLRSTAEALELLRTATADSSAERSGPERQRVEITFTVRDLSELRYLSRSLAVLSRGVSGFAGDDDRLRATFLVEAGSEVEGWSDILSFAPLLPSNHDTYSYYDDYHRPVSFTVRPERIAYTRPLTAATSIAGKIVGARVGETPIDVSRDSDIDLVPEYLEPGQTLVVEIETSDTVDEPRLSCPDARQLCFGTRAWAQVLASEEAARSSQAEGAIYGSYAVPVVLIAIGVFLLVTNPPAAFLEWAAVAGWAVAVVVAVRWAIRRSRAARAAFRSIDVAGFEWVRDSSPCC